VNRKPPTRFKGILFDLWETLINDTPERAMPRRVWRSERVRTILASHGFEAGTELVQTALDNSTRALTTLHDTGTDLDSEGRAHLFLTQLEQLTEIGAPQSAIPELEAAITAMPLDMAPRLALHAVEALSAIKAQGLATALVCNAGFTTAPHLRPMLEHYELLPHLDHLVFSDELQIAKPDPRIFNTALAAIGLTAADCAFIGDNPHTDIGGALGCGLYTIQIGAKTREGITPHARIDALDQLLAALDLA
jgi:HAD superfamily hydrolase (TIGR01509 family)